ncbi:SDR family NAD(P)-dependent oxidoreductase [Pseudonocardia ailaonensis]|uniref:SDR family NAD(P)-dependent oxidoreductase n=1 Tax=Pseudonocardia ailaonensis TaxID=367279 RepID=A0ABN2MWB0_9PSEU
MKVALVTGGGSGIGAAVVRSLAAEGARVAVVDRDLARAEEVAGDLPHAVAVAADVADPDQARRMVAAAVEAFGSLDVAVNCAGVGAGGTAPTAEIEPETWAAVRSVNLDGVFFSMRAEIPAILAAGGGAIVTVASIMGLVAHTGSAAYVAAKHGVLGLTKAAALDYATHGIRINAVAPGYVRTPLLGSQSDEYLGALAERHPVQRIATPEEVAAVVAFLCGAGAGFVTGACYPVDGGYTAR